MDQKPAALSKLHEGPGSRAPRAGARATRAQRGRKRTRRSTWTSTSKLPPGTLPYANLCLFGSARENEWKVEVPRLQAWAQHRPRRVATGLASPRPWPRFRLAKLALAKNFASAPLAAAWPQRSWLWPLRPRPASRPSAAQASVASRRSAHLFRRAFFSLRPALNASRPACRGERPKC